MGREAQGERRIEGHQVNEWVGKGGGDEPSKSTVQSGEKEMYIQCTIIVLLNKVGLRKGKWLEIFKFKSKC